MMGYLVAFLIGWFIASIASMFGIPAIIWVPASIAAGVLVSHYEI